MRKEIEIQTTKSMIDNLFWKYDSYLEMLKEALLELERVDPDNKVVKGIMYRLEEDLGK